MKENKIFIGGVIAVVLVAAVLIYATSSGVDYTGSTVYDVDDEVKTFYLYANEYTFEPNEIVVHKDDKVRFYLKSEDYSHSLVMGDFGVDMGPVEVGESDVEEFVAWKTGEFYFYDNERSFLEEHDDREEMIQGTFIVLP